MAISTFSELSESTARDLWVVPSILVIPKSCAQNLSIHPDVEYTTFSNIHKEISAEVVQPISTRGNCECSSAGVISETKNITQQILASEQVLVLFVYHRRMFALKRELSWGNWKTKQKNRQKYNLSSPLAGAAGYLLVFVITFHTQRIMAQKSLRLLQLKDIVKTSWWEPRVQNSALQEKTMTKQPNTSASHKFVLGW